MCGTPPGCESQQPSAHCEVLVTDPEDDARAFNYAVVERDAQFGTADEFADWWSRVGWRSTATTLRWVSAKATHDLAWVDAKFNAETVNRTVQRLVCIRLLGAPPGRRP